MARVRVGSPGGTTLALDPSQQLLASQGVDGSVRIWRN
jgi:hypothetical protein